MEENKTEVVEAKETEDRIPVEVVDGKEGIMQKAKKKWKWIAAGAAVIGGVVIAKVVKSKSKPTDDDFELDDDDTFIGNDDVVDDVTDE